MLHRTTWFAIPIVALVLAGTSVGWWGYNQYQGRQAMALETENQYNSNFHALVDDMNRLQQEFGKAMVSGDPAAFQKRLRDVWRLSYAAQTEVGRLPFELMPMHNTQQFLARISKQTEQWMNTNANPSTAAVQRQLKSMYDEAGQIHDSLVKVQGQAFAGKLRWMAVNQDLRKQNRDNQVIDGFRKIDTAASAFAESEDHPTSMQRGKTYAMANQRDVAPATATKKVSDFLQLNSNQVKLNVEKTKPGAYRPEYIVTGNTPRGELYATVSLDGGHVLSYTLRRETTKGDYDYSEAQAKAQHWLSTKGFPETDIVQSYQHDGIAYFVLAPKMKDGSVVVSQGIGIRVALDNGDIVGYDANNYFYYPVKDLPSREFTAAQLRKKINPTFQIGMEKQVIVLDENHTYQPATAFYGTSNDDTYCVYINAHTGQELNIERLS